MVNDVFGDGFVILKGFVMIGFVIDLMIGKDFVIENMVKLVVI